MNLKQQKGQTLIESCFISFFLFSLILGIFTLVYLGFIKLWIDHQAHQGLFCMATPQPVYQCKKKIHNQLNQFLIYGKINRLNLNRSSQYLKSEISFQFSKKIIFKSEFKRKNPNQVIL